MTISIYLTHPEVPCWNFSQDNLNQLKDALPKENIFLCKDEQDFLNILPKTHIALIWTFKQEWLTQAGSLQWIVTPAAGKDYFDIKPAFKLTIDYCSFHGEIMGETVLAMILAHTRGIRDVVVLQKDNPWPRAKIWKNMKPFRGSSLVILGFGNIGLWIGRLAKPFGVRITGIKQKLIDPPDYFDSHDRIICVEELDSVLPEIDHLVLALPGGNKTTDIINMHRLNLMPVHSVIYNVGRGNAICETDLINALRNGSIAAAYLDVVKDEPLSELSPLRKCPNCLIMPHASAISPNYLDLFVKEFINKFNKRYYKPDK